MDASPVLEPFPIHRFVHYSDFTPYRPFSSEQPENFLDNVHGIKEPNILLLGCGDLLSCFYTIWKNFRGGITKEFDGIHFVMNDRSAGILARDVLCLYLCMTMPHESLALRKWLCCFWSIWYSHELLSEHQLLLDENLEKLILLSKSIETWSNPKNPLHKLVSFTSLDTLKKIRAMWIMWHQRQLTVRPVVHVFRDTTSERTKKLNSVEAIVTAAFDGSKHGGATADPRQSSMMQEVTDYLNSGTVYAEQVLIDEPVEKSRTTTNLTFYERKDGKYALNYGSLPFNCYYQSMKYSRQELLSFGAFKGTLDTLLVRDYHFESLPYLSNSVQQFALWLRCCATSFKDMSSAHDVCPITFTFHCSDAIDFCMHLQTSSLASNLACCKIFDLIDSSNLADQLALPLLVFSSLPLLKPGCVHLTCVRYKSTAQTLEDYIYKMFRVDLKLLPVLFGVRCVNHEGSPYSSVISVQPHSFQANHIPPRRWRKVIIWERIVCLPIKHSSILAKYSNFVLNLSSAVSNAIIPLGMNEKGQAILNHMSIETAMRILHTFAARVEGNTNSYTFWDPLATVLFKKSEIRSYMYCLQTQAFLHGIHLHLTVNKDNCPICQRVPLTGAISQVRVPLDPKVVSGTSSFIVYIHQRSKIDERASNLQPIAAGDLTIQIMDNVTGVLKDGELTLDFFVPLRYIEDNYNFTLVSYRVERCIDREIDIPAILTVKPLLKYQVPSISYSFLNTPALYYSPVSMLGVLDLNAGNHESFVTIISVHEQNVTLFDSLAPHKENPNEIHITMRSHRYTLSYPYPVNYDTLTIRISRKQRTVTVLANRIANDFESEKCFFFANNSDEFTKLLYPLNETAMHTYTSIQFSTSEQKIVKDLMLNPTKMPPIVHLKQCLTFFLQCQTDHFFNVAIPVNNIHALIVVQDRAFDVQRRTPVLDLAFSFLDLQSVGDVAIKWQTLTPMATTKCLTVSAVQLELLKSTLFFFARRTVGHGLSKAKGKYAVLRRYKIDQHFTRALVYPLYADPDAPDVKHPSDQPQISTAGFDKQAVLRILESINLKDPLTKIVDGEVPDIDITGESMRTENTEQKTSDATAKKRAKITEEKVKTSEKKPAVPAQEKPTTSTQEKRKHSGSKRGKSAKKTKDKSAGSTKEKTSPSTQEKLTMNTHEKSSASSQEKGDSVKDSSHKARKPKESSSAATAEKKRGCANCGEKVSAMKQCASCGKVKYCSRECQKKHWKIHKPDCKKSTSEADEDCTDTKNECELAECTYCGKKSSTLKKCGACNNARYCDETCQKEDWKNHKTMCKSMKINN